MAQPLHIRPMTRSELDQLVAWAADEGWNPGLHDADSFWATDPDAFIAAELGGELVGGGAITSYGGQYGFMGFFIIRLPFRGKGLGDQLWHARLTRLQSRLAPGAGIGMDGVFDMQPYYAKGGFVFSHRNLRFCAQIPKDLAAPAPHPALVPLKELAFETLLAFDSHCFGVDRRRFLKAWVNQADATGLAYLQGGVLAGYALVRRCRQGYKIGPLFADTPAIAETLFDALAPVAAGGPLYLDVPEAHQEAMVLASAKGMSEVFGCARMYLGPKPAAEDNKVFGVTTFELG